MKRTKVRIKLINPCNKKFEFFKLIRSCTGLGLKGCKDIVDKLHETPEKYQEILIKLPDADTDFLNIFMTEIHNLGDFRVSGGLEWIRNFKILSLGFSDQNDYVNFIIDDLLSKNSDDSKNILTFVMSKLSKKDLMEVFKLVEKEYKDLNK